MDQKRADAKHRRRAKRAKCILQGCRLNMMRLGMLTAPWATQIKALQGIPRIMPDYLPVKQITDTSDQDKPTSAVGWTPVHIHAGPTKQRTMSNRQRCPFVTQSESTLETITKDEVNKWTRTIKYNLNWDRVNRPTGQRLFEMNFKELGAHASAAPRATASTTNIRVQETMPALRQMYALWQQPVTKDKRNQEQLPNQLHAWDTNRKCIRRSAAGHSRPNRSNCSQKQKRPQPLQHHHADCVWRARRCGHPITPARTTGERPSKNTSCLPQGQGKTLDETSEAMRHDKPKRHPGLWAPDAQFQTALPLGTPNKTTQHDKIKGKDGSPTLFLNTNYLFDGAVDQRGRIHEPGSPPFVIHLARIPHVWARRADPSGRARPRAPKAIPRTNTLTLQHLADIDVPADNHKHRKDDHKIKGPTTTQADNKQATRRRHTKTRNNVDTTRIPRGAQTEDVDQLLWECVAARRKRSQPFLARMQLHRPHTNRLKGPWRESPSTYESPRQFTNWGDVIDMHLPDLSNYLKRKDRVAEQLQYRHTTAEQTMQTLHGPSAHSLPDMPEKTQGTHTGTQPPTQTETSNTTNANGPTPARLAYLSSTEA